MRVSASVSTALAALLAAGLAGLPQANAQQEQDQRQARTEAQGQEQAGREQQEKGEAQWVDLTTWDTASVYEGWSAEQLLDEDVYGATGDEIGELEDMIIGPDGQIQYVVVEGSGFLDIADTHAAVPWDRVTRIGTSSIAIDVPEGNLDKVGRFPNVEDEPAIPKNFRVTKLIGDVVTAGGAGYGTVDDVIFNDEGKIQAVVVAPALGYDGPEDRVAIPYNAEGYDPYSPHYQTPYDVAQLNELQPYNYTKFQ